jgi:type I restriction enzyme M protein
MVDNLSKIFSSPEVLHGFALFDKKELAWIEKSLVEKNGKFFIKCQVKEKLKLAKPEEIVRQLFIRQLITEYGYNERIEVEKTIWFSSSEFRHADIVVLHEDLIHPYIIFEVKRPKRSDGLEQLRSYCNAEGAPIGVWSNGNEMIRLHREEPNIFVEIPRIPKATETLRDILTKRWNLEWLEENDELKKGKTTLKKILLDLEELVLGNAGVDPFEEIFKLIYAKLYDEWRGINDPRYRLDFFVGDRSPEHVKTAISNLLEGAKRQWSGVFEPTDRIELRDEHLKVCISFLEKIKLFNSNLQIIDEAFEYLIPAVSKKKEGQFFTPRPVEDMAIKMLNPKPNEFIIDPACGSAGFLLHSVMWVAGGVISGKELPLPARNFAQNNIFGIDFAKKAVKIAKAINLIVGDGKAHIYKANALAPQTWDDETKAGLRAKLLRFLNEPEKDKVNQNKFLYLDFDVLMTNPPFAGTVKERDILKLYNLAEKNGKLVTKIGRHILFLERSLQLTKPGGRIAIVLPQGLLNNTQTEYIRRFVTDQARILAVVGLHGNTFKPHTGTKTSVLFLQKYTNEENQKIQAIKAKYEKEWEDFIGGLKVEYREISWDKPIDEERLPEELKSFIESYFEFWEESGEQEEESEVEENEESKRKKSLQVLVEKMVEQQTLLNEKQDELNKAPNNGKEELRKEVRTLRNTLNKIHREVLEITPSGQIWLTLNDEKMIERFKEFWLHGKIIKEMDYPIFFAVNQKPLKNNSGEYRYKKSPNGEFLLDKYGHPIIDHDLDKIADAFVKFAKENEFDFWRT